MTGGIQKQCSAHYQVKFSWDCSLGCNLGCWPISELTTPAASVGMSLCSLPCPSGCQRCSKSCLSLSGTFQRIHLLPWQARLCLSVAVGLCSTVSRRAGDGCSAPVPRTPTLLLAHTFHFSSTHKTQTTPVTPARGPSRSGGRSCGGASALCVKNDLVSLWEISLCRVSRV